MPIERSREWWLARIDAEPDEPVGAASGLADEEVPAGLSDALAAPSFGEFVHLLRRREGLSVDRFAEAADIELSDAQAIEEDPFYRVDPRTVWAIARTYHLPHGALNEMAGVVVANDVEPFVDRHRYAARSELVTALSAEEVVLLAVVVSVIGDRATA